MKRYNNNNDNTSFIQGKRKNRLNYTSNCHPGTVKIRKTYFAKKLITSCYLLRHVSCPIGHFRVPKPLIFKTRLSAKPFCDNEFHLNENEK